jgi:uncharacterized protein (DUF433 family)
MTMVIAAEPVPIRIDEHGRAQIANTRVTLELVVAAYKSGQTPEQIQEDYDVLTLDDIYAVITYYLRHKDSVEEYILERREIGERVKREIQEKQGNFHIGLKERLLERARQAAEKQP